MTYVTIFKSLSEINSPFQITLEEALDRIREGRSKEKVELIRQKIIEGKPYDEDKKNLPFVVFSAAKTQSIEVKGRPSHRADGSVVEHSGVFVLDFDKCDVEQQLSHLKSDPFILACWVAPSGTGVKALVKCPKNIDNHNLYYTAYLERYPSLDPTSRNLSRGTFESYDPNIWINWGSLVWDKKLTEEQRKKNKEKELNRRGKSVLSTAVAMVRTALDGEKHDTLLKAATLVGGYVSAGRVNEQEAVKLLEEEIRAKSPKDMEGAIQTIIDGVEYGKKRPLIEAKKIEKAQQYLRREDGTYDFLADQQETDEYLRAVIDGTIEQGLPTGFTDLNTHWVIKKHHLVIWGALDGIGKSFLVWYMGVIAAMFHGWKVIINSNENSDGELTKKLMEYFLGKSIKVADDEEITIAHDFVKEQFRIISSKNLHSLEEFLFKCEVLIDEGFEANLVIADPMNSFDVPLEVNMYSNTLKSMNQLRVFKENFCSVWLTDHIGTQAARKKDKNGFIEVPWKSDIDQGQMKSNKTDDFIILHRLINHEYDRNKLQIHVGKVKSIESGGRPTMKDEPVIIEINSDLCGFNSNGRDPIKEYWAKKI